MCLGEVAYNTFLTEEYHRFNALGFDALYYLNEADLEGVKHMAQTAAKTKGGHHF